MQLTTEPRTTMRWQPARLGGDDGAAMVETALTFPIIFGVMVAIFEFGLVFRDYLTVSDAVGDGARAGAIMGNKTDAGKNGDYVVIQALRNGFGGIPVEWIDSIVIFEGSNLGVGSPLDQVPSGCKAPGASSQAGCNVYHPYTAFLQLQAGNTAYFSCPGTGPACGWSPSARSDGTGSNIGAPNLDYLGVYVRLDRAYVTGLLGQSFRLEVAAVQRLEPGFLDQ
jgi:hypothetical protein